MKRISSEDKVIINRIERNKFKTPKEKTTIYSDIGYRFGGFFESSVTKGKIYACGECGFQSMYKMAQYIHSDTPEVVEEVVSEICVCARCNGTKLKMIEIKKAEKLCKKFDALLKQTDF